MLRRHAVWPNERTHVSASPRWWLGRLRSISAPVCALATTTLAPSAFTSAALAPSASSAYATELAPSAALAPSATLPTTMSATKPDTVSTSTLTSILNNPNGCDCFRNRLRRCWS
jgi:hypothetical protein